MVEGQEPITERRLREVIGTWDWQEQRLMWAINRPAVVASRQTALADNE
jgi:hypothetical protein